jgi:predicted Fe-Mo cluster-binding NifX family protein
MRRKGAILALALLLISPWPIFALQIIKKPDPYRVAVPAEGESLSSPVSPVFARGRTFQIVDLKTSRVEVVQNPYRDARHAAGLRSAHLLLNRNVGAVVAIHIGPEPYNTLGSRGVWTFTGHPGSVRQAIDQYVRKELALARNPNVPIHYGLQQQGRAVPPTGPCPLADAPAGGTRVR